MRQRLEAGPRLEDRVCSLRGVDVQRILRKSSVCCVRCRRCIGCCIDWAIRISVHDHAIDAPTGGASRFCPRLTPVSGGDRCGPSRQATARVLSRRSSVWPTGNDDQRLGHHGEPAHGHSADRVSIPLGLGSRLSRHRPSRRPAQSPLEHHGRQFVFGTILGGLSAVGSGGDDLGCAGFHRRRQLRVPDNITLLALPAYSPELNPIENLWHYLKSHYWSNRAYADYDALEQAALDAWQHAVLNPNE